MTTFSANIGLLWTDRELPDRVRAAKAAGFAAVECHWPYDTPAEAVAAALDETGLPMLSLNSPRGDMEAGEFGLAAVPGRESDARASIDRAVDYALAIGARNIHVIAGLTNGDAANRAYVAALSYAADLTSTHGIGVLIEPVNRHDAPGYFLRTTDQARAIIDEVDAANVKLMFDCYHVARTEGDLTTRLTELAPIIGHFQFASVPDRGAPDHGEIDYRAVFAAIESIGWTEPLGAEYRPEGDTDASLGWMAALG